MKTIKCVLIGLMLCSIFEFDTLAQTTTFENTCVKDTIVNARTLYVHEMKFNGSLSVTHYYGIDNNYVKRYAYKHPGESIQYWNEPVPIVCKLTNIVIGDYWYNNYNGRTAKETVVDTASLLYKGNLHLCYVVRAIDSANSNYMATSWYCNNYGMMQGCGPSTFIDTMRISNIQILGGNGFFPLCVGNSWTGASIVTNVENESRIVPNKCSLYQNYPNPFNPTTHFSFTISTRSFVSLKVFDLLGQEVASLISEVLSAGPQIYTWNASSLPSGVYFYRLKAGSFSEIKKLVLLK